MDQAAERPRPRLSDPRIIKDDRGAHRVLFGDNEEGQFKDCRNGQGAYGGVWTEIEAECNAADVTVIDVPISGGVGGAKAGTLAMMVSGNPAKVSDLMPVSAALGQDGGRCR